MTIDIALSKVGVFDYEPNRHSATRRLLKNFNKGDAVWFVDGDAVRLAYSFSRYAHTLSKLSSQLYNSMPRENGFDIHATNGPAIQYSSLLITRHALERWEQRARQMFPPINKFIDMNELMATKSMYEDMIFDNGKRQLEVFYPFGEGAFIIEITVTPEEEYYNFINSMAYAKNTACLGNYNYNKAKRRWVGEFVPRGGNVVVKTYLGWDELKKGGTFNSVDWYRQNFEWQRLPSDWTAKMREMGIDW